MVVMKTDRITIIHGNIDVAPEAIGLEACLINFAFVDKMRFGFLRNIAECFPDTQVNIKAISEAEADDTREDLLGRLQRILQAIQLAQTDITGTAIGFVQILAEILEQNFVPAGRARAVAVHAV